MEIVVKIDGLRTHFSESMLWRSLLKTGIDLTTALEITKKIEEEVKEKKEITSEELFETCFNLLQEMGGKEYAERYRIWHWYNILRREGKVNPLIILVGGSPNVGKTVTTTDLAFRLTIARVLTTDAVRRIVKTLIPKEKEPVLHVPTFEAWKVIDECPPDTEPELYGFMKQVDALKPYIQEIVEKTIKNGIDLAIEGVHLAPWILPDEIENLDNVIHVIISAPEEEVYRDMFLSKMLREGRKMDENIFKYFEICLKINDLITQKAKERGITVVKFKDFEQVMEEILSIVCERVAKIVSSVKLCEESIRGPSYTL